MSKCVFKADATRVAISLGLAACLAVQAHPADWPHYRGSNCDGSTPEEIVTWPPQELWTAQIGTGYSSVAVVGRRVFAIGHDAGAFPDSYGLDTVYCLDADSGTVLWTYSYRCLSEKGSLGGPSDLAQAGPRATPAADGSRVYTLSLDGHLHCLDASTGKLLWYRNIVEHLGGTVKMYGCCSSPVIVGTSMLLLDVGGTLTALDRTTGALLWSTTAGRGGTGAVTPAVATLGGVPCAVFGSRDISCARLADGTLLWKLDMGREAIASHLVIGDKVLYSACPETGKTGLLSVDTGSPSADWVLSNVKTYHLSNLAYGSYAFIMDNSGTELYSNDSSTSSLKCIELATGQTKWTKTGLGWANQVLAKDKLIILREQGELLSANASPSINPNSDFQNAGVIMNRWCWVQPAIASGRLYCRNEKGALKCLSIAPAVGIEAIQPVAQEGGASGVFRVTRIGDANSALTVSISIGGTEEQDGYSLSASAGSITDTTLTIPAGIVQLDVTITPVADSDTDDETVTITLQEGSGYAIVSEASEATVWILDSSTSLPTVTVTSSGADAWALEGGLDVGRFIVSRSSPAGWPLVVSVSIGGTADPNDFTLRGIQGDTVTIPTGSAQAVVTVEVIDNDLVNSSDRTVVLSLDNGSFYTIGSPSSATVTLVDDDGSPVDTDNDQMDDLWELAWWGDLSRGGAEDFDSDGLTNAAEYAAGTNPTLADTDRDGTSDGDEVSGGSDPLDPRSFVLSGGGGGGSSGGGCAPAAAGTLAAGLFIAIALAALLRRS